MSKLVGIIDIGRYLVAVLPVKEAEHVLIAFLAGSYHSYLDVVLTKLDHHVSYEIETFLVGKA